ncbi:hypothetical protein G9A89_020118 [Geosiphon pyriformis]|nr:hypothetical protein G9A89_020118 [Geosiphon pyriformis]
MSMWENSKDVAKTIDYVFVSSNLVNAILYCDVLSISEHFDTDFHAVFVSVSLGGFLDDYNKVFTKKLSRFYKLEVLVSRLAKASYEVVFNKFVSLLKHWDSLDPDKTFIIQVFICSGADFDCIYFAFFGIKKSYNAFKLAESLCAEELGIRSVIKK